MPQVGALKRVLPVNVFDGWDVKKDGKSPYAQKVPGPGPPALVQNKVKSSNRQVCDFG
jgi:hypothetical protein